MTKLSSQTRNHFFENDTACHHVFLGKHGEFCKAYILFQENNLSPNVCENTFKTKPLLTLLTYNLKLAMSSSKQLVTSHIVVPPKTITLMTW